MATFIDSLDDLYEDLRVAGPTEYGDDLLQLQFVLENQAARALFVEYSAAWFAAENVRFLTALFDSHRYLLVCDSCVHLPDRSSRHLSTHSGQFRALRVRGCAGQHQEAPGPAHGAEGPHHADALQQCTCPNVFPSVKAHHGALA
jgi:hypothetical protein